MNKAIFILSAFVFFSSSLSVQAAGGRTDYDFDDDGLIEINDLADLHEIRNNLDGSSLYGDSTGCPDAGCNGFELTTDLNFDTNADGVMDAGDDYWNDGDGWVPLGDYNDPFTAVFDGNGYRILNLYISRDDTRYIGLFGGTLSANIRQLGLTGSLMGLSGYIYTGGVIGIAWDTKLTAVYTTGNVVGDSFVGGLIGEASTSQIESSYSASSVSALTLVGGLVGLGRESIEIVNSFSAGSVVASETGIWEGGILGAYTPDKGLNSSEIRTDGMTVLNSYWVTDSFGQGDSYASSEYEESGGFLLSDLQCPTAADNSSCVTDTTLYSGWADATYTDGDNKVVAYWDFGTGTQLPGLNLNGTVYRDRDGDGSLDDDDAFKNNPAASRDADKDGYPDAWNIGCDADCIAASGLTLDQFPSTVAAWQDDDLDGYPDSWADSCDSLCQAASGLTLDRFPDDYDNDGLITAMDNDDNGDGVTDADADSDGLIDIASLEHLNAIRYNLAGTGLTLTDGGDIDSSGCPARIVDGILQNLCWGYELTADLDFDTNADGVMDAGDDYWNGGDGWKPLGSYLGSINNDPFTAVFEGNGYRILNLYIDRSSTSQVGLFGYTDGADVRNLGLTGALMQVTGSGYVGGLAGRIVESNITNSYATGDITVGNSSVGGLIGYTSSSTITGSYATGSVKVAGDSAGGLIGYASSASTVSNSYATAAVSGNQYVGGLIGRISGSEISNSYASGSVSASSYSGGIAGYAENSTSISNSYWATDSTGQDEVMGDDDTSTALTENAGVLLSELRCPVSADDTDCVFGTTLYQGWGNYLYISTAEEVKSYWQFGTAEDLPELSLDDYLADYVDTDDDGVLDYFDAFPEDASETTDSDGDGVGDNTDAFPEDASETTDSDGDGVGDNADAFPEDASRWQAETSSGSSSGGGSLIWLLGLAPLAAVRRRAVKWRNAA